MVRVGLLGSGFMGETHASAYRNMTDVELVGVYTRNADKGREFAGRFGTSFFPDAQTLYAQVDVVDICLPTYLHEQYCVEAARAGKHILCEKPIALTRDSLDRIGAAVQETGVIFMAAQVLRFWPEYQELKRQVQSGQIGEVLEISMQRLAQAPSWSAWFKDPERSGGALFDLHIHDLDMARHLLGPIATVYAVGVNQAGAWNHVVTTLTAQSGAKAVCEGSFLLPSGYPFTMSARLLGTSAAAEFVLKAGVNLENRSEAKNELMVYHNGPELWTSTGADAYEQEIRYFISCVVKGESASIVPFSEVVDVLDIVLAAKRSLETGQVVHLS
ncbi:Gfo/Idh/MocA family oxidoreductase [Alicyclobacillus tolerans]|uniref:Gfo/Idh/MocA family protein n=1 Tax=Alicyclobacillus tolerans TaxID=90970 RepID=UPI001F380A58|nr:Gfo/Idh/MocA family oxidoreductase [Alicyclobacillus tolerans]MCF8566695.1 Gfo/Idh/MocA family oxidoreductase [Alicyclobacillus tolerans]